VTILDWVTISKKSVFRKDVKKLIMPGISSPTNTNIHLNAGAYLKLNYQFLLAVFHPKLFEFELEIRKVPMGTGKSSTLLPIIHVQWQ
jgi:hypothetical protein